ncbi:MAG: BamA/TamA family outer membrane protein [Chlorobi bacterium]|nr:BamA/TamA family outer membrane protein [Chlorobiota bacterium]
MKTGLAIFITIFCLTISLSAQTKDSTDASGFSVFGYPYAFYTPETNFAFGAAGMGYFRTDSKPKTKLSSILLSGYYTVNNQYDLTVTPELYFGNNEYLISGDFYYGKYIDKFFGVGSNTPEINNPDYATHEFGIKLNIQTRIVGSLELGFIYDLLNSDIADKKENPFLINDDVLGKDGGVSSGLGFKFVFDSRDYLYLPTSGGYYIFNAIFYGAGLGSKYSFTDYLIDIRQYFQLAKRHLLTFQLYCNFMSGNPPFYEIPRLGGRMTMRGYYKGRYRDKNYFAAQTELKSWLWKDFNLGFVLFAGFGDVAARFSQFKLTQLQYSYGFGLRYIFDEKERLTVRADFGFGKNTSGIYFAMQESF